VCDLETSRICAPYIYIYIYIYDISSLRVNLWARRTHVWFPAGLRDFSLLQNFQAVSATHQTSYSNFTASYFLCCKTAGTWNWPLSNADVTNQYAFMMYTIKHMPYRRMDKHCIDVTMTYFIWKNCILTTEIGDC